MNTQTISLIYGIVFFAVGVFGFFDNPIVSSSGLFVTNLPHNVVHMVLGVIFLVGATNYLMNASRLLILMGLGGLIVSFVGFTGFSTIDNHLLGIVQVNTADHWLHLGLALIVLTSGMVFPDKREALNIA